MSRDATPYAQRRAAAAFAGRMVTDTPEAGYYRLNRGVWRPVHIWYGPPLDPWDGSVMDRYWRWNFLFNGRIIWDQQLVWPQCAKHPIDKAEYDYLIARIRHAKEHDKNDPFGRRGKVDWLTATPPSFD